MGCNDKIKNTCGTKLPATCVPTEVDVNLPYSTLKDEACLTIEETTQDIYDQIKEVRKSLEIDIKDSCTEYNLNEYNFIDVKEFATKINDKVCDLEDRLQILENKSICEYSLEDCNLNLGTLVDDCGVQPLNLGELLQILINNQ